MKVKVCPKCGKHNSESAWSCADCGETLSMKTLIDTDSGQKLNVTSIAGHTTLSEISACFEEDIVKTLKTDIRIDESIIWGGNFAKLSNPPSYIFGYCIITSKQLVCVKFVSDTKRKKASSGIQLMLNPLAFAAKEMVGVYEDSTHPWANVGLSKVPYPSQKLTQSELNSREVITNNLRNLTSVQLLSDWHNEVIIKSLAIKFEAENEFTITFYSPNQAENAHQLLTEQLGKPFP